MISDLLQKSKTNRFTGSIIIKNLITKNLNVTTINQSRVTRSNKKSIIFNSDVITDNLIVDRINKIKWDYLYNNVYQKDKSTEIIGKLLIEQTGFVNYLQTQLIDDRSTNDFFTLKTNQEINSLIFINKFNVDSLSTNLINDIELSRFATYLDEVNFIETPIKIFHLNILSTLSISDNANTDNLRNIIGTKFEDLSQIYTGRVIIDGSLFLNDLFVDGTKAQILVQKKIFQSDVNSNYWMKNINQVSFTRVFHESRKDLHGS